MTARTKTERATLSIRGYKLEHRTTVYLHDRTIDSAVLLGIVITGHHRSLAPNLSSWIDLKLNEEIDRALEKIQNKAKKGIMQGDQ